MHHPIYRIVRADHSALAFSDELYGLPGKAKAVTKYQQVTWLELATLMDGTVEGENQHHLVGGHTVLGTYLSNLLGEEKTAKILFDLARTCGTIVDIVNLEDL